MNYLFMCMKRGGQHAVVNWFAQQNNHNTLHYNNCTNGWEQNQLLPMKQHMVVHYEYENENHKITNFFVDHKIDLQESRRLQTLFQNSEFPNIKDRLYNIEDLSIEEYNKLEMWNFEQLKNNSKSILILRDPFNFIASCLQRLVNPPDAGATDVGVQLPQRLLVWKEHARQALEKSEAKAPIEFISFNEWFASESYRSSLCERFGLIFTDRGVNKVMNFGSGSSFDRENFDGSAQKMKILERYKAWENHSAFKYLVDDEIRHYAKEIFDMEL